MGGFHIGDAIIQLIFLLLTLAPIVLIVIGFVYLTRMIKRAEKRSEARLKMDNENAKFQEEQIRTINDLNKRLTNIERMLKDVD
ncbi:hypothetical protein ACFSTA_03230 [Ornithinibacillus salinisoli]|uniref:DUF4083 domain-containing protein n=1 Tax=Ornithinibacillus salinisoli TaxID=1848459 RepID=A0ABW4VUK7_9BACI